MAFAGNSCLVHLLLFLDVALLFGASVQGVGIFGRESWLVEEGQGPKKQPKKSQEAVAFIHHPNNDDWTRG